MPISTKCVECVLYEAGLIADPGGGPPPHFACGGGGVCFSFLLFPLLAPSMNAIPISATPAILPTTGPATHALLAVLALTPCWLAAWASAPAVIVAVTVEMTVSVGMSSVRQSACALDARINMMYLFLAIPYRWYRRSRRGDMYTRLPTVAQRVMSG